MKTYLYRITCLTNLHVGNGEDNYSVIGNEVERDPVLANVPIINGSGVKGALREHCCSSGLPACSIDYIFGAETAAGNGANNGSKPGNFKFLSANLLARPLRVSRGSMSYVLTTTSEIIKNFKTLAEGLNYEQLGSISTMQIPTEKIIASKKGLSIENEVAGTFDLKEYPYLEKLIWNKDDRNKGGKDAGVFAIAQPKFAADCSLPVLARNKLENGESKNLWYEEIVPHKSVFYLFILTPDNDKATTAKTEFDACITGKGIYVQFGGNATVGQGYCKVEKVEHE